MAANPTKMRRVEVIFFVKRKFLFSLSIKNLNKRGIFFTGVCRLNLSNTNQFFYHQALEISSNRVKPLDTGTRRTNKLWVKKFGPIFFVQFLAVKIYIFGHFVFVVIVIIVIVFAAIVYIVIFFVVIVIFCFVVFLVSLSSLFRCLR